MNPHHAPHLLQAACALALRLALAAWALLALWLVLATPARAEAVLSEATRAELQRLADGSARLAQPGLRVVVQAGALDARLKLAPCQRIQPYLPPGAPLWGRTRAGLRCLEGPVRWNVSLPLTVQVFGRAQVAAQPLPAGTVISASHLAEAEVDLAEQRDPVLPAADLLGRTLARGVAGGQALRAPDLKTRQWFTTGDTVRVVAVGQGFAVSAQAEALTPGLEGQPSRARLESGRVVVGKAVGERRLELNL